MYDPDSIESFERVLLWRRVRVVAKKLSLPIALLAMAAGTFLVINDGPAIWSKRAGEQVLVSTPAKAVVSYRQAGRWRIRETYRPVGRWLVYSADGY
jgi:hypothetical protein